MRGKIWGAFVDACLPWRHNWKLSLMNARDWEENSLTFALSGYDLLPLPWSYSFLGGEQMIGYLASCLVFVIHLYIIKAEISLKSF